MTWLNLVLAWFGLALVKREPDLALAQAKALAAPASPLERVSSAPAKPLRIGRSSYAEAQMVWEWDHNRRARELVEKAKNGFF